jgi:hypothetical protein
MWLAQPQVRIRHSRDASVDAATLWSAAQAVRLNETRRLGRLVRSRIPGLAPELPFDAMFRAQPFTVLEEGDAVLVSGLVGRIWTLRRDYPTLSDPAEFRAWSAPGTVRVLFASWVQPTDAGGAALVNEVRVAAVDRWGRLGLAAVRPLIASSHSLISTDGIDVAVRRAQAGGS